MGISLNIENMKLGLEPLKFCGFRLQPSTIAYLRNKKNMSEFVRFAVTTAIDAENSQCEKPV
jgi:hypothetical protein